MTRPASYNAPWGYNSQQIADEWNPKTQEFMKTGWEGGSDKKPPHAPTQNYHMQKTDLSLQEIERQGLLSWRNDVPYQKGARVFWHGSTFQALKDTTGTEPQGSGDNGTWYLVPIQNYPSSYESVKGLGTAAKKNEGDFDRAGAAQEVRESLKQIAKTGELNDGTGTLAMSHGGTGRNDGDLQAGTVYAHTIHHKNGTVALKTESGDVLTVENGNIASFKHSDGVESFRIDNGRISFGGGWNDPNLYKEGGDIVVRASSGDMLRVEKGNALTFKRADGSETMRVQNGLLTLSGGSRPTLMRFDYGTVLMAESGDSVGIEKGCALVAKNARGDVEFKVTGGSLFLTGEDRPVLSRLDHGTFLTAKSGDYLSIEPGNAIAAHDSSGKLTLKFENGVMTVGTVPFEHVSGNVPFKRVDGMGDAAAKGFFDTGDVDKVPYGEYAAASTGCVAALRDFTKKLVDALKNSLGAAAWKGVVDTGQPEDVGWGSEKLASAGCVSGLFYRMQEHQKVGTTALMVYSGSQGKTIGEVVSASELRFSSADGNPADATTPQGKWRCLGYCKGGDYPGRSRTTLFVRIE